MKEHFISYSHFILGMALGEDGNPPPYHDLGTFRLIDCGDYMVDAMVELYRHHVSSVLRDHPDQREVHKLKEIHSILLFEAYLIGVKNPEKYHDHFIEKVFSPHRHRPDREGWYRYIQDMNPNFWDLLHEPFPVYIPETARQRSTYLVAKAGGGKSELLKRFVYHYLTDITDCAAVVIDPAGDFALQIAQWKENITNKRLIYLSPDLDLSQTPVINPFEIDGIAPTDTSLEALAAKKVVAQQLLEALEQIVVERGDASLSKNMRTILMPCLLALLDKEEGATLRDLRLFMDDKRNQELVAFGASLTHYPDVQDFFNHLFQAKHFTITKDAVRSKLQDLFTTGNFANLTCGESTVSLEQAWREKKVVVINLNKGKMGSQAARAFGRLVVALLQGIATRQGDIPEPKRIPCHLILDELENFTSEAMKLILTESRKYKLMFTGCQQTVGSGLDKDVQLAVLGSSDVKIGGQAEPIYRKDTAALFPVEPEKIGTLQQGEFYIRLGDKPPFKLRVHDALLGDRNAMTPTEWGRVRQVQLERYYGPTAQTPAPNRPPELSDMERLAQSINSLKRKEENPFDADVI
jgi:hypothetical protein